MFPGGDRNAPGASTREPQLKSMMRETTETAQNCTVLAQLSFPFLDGTDEYIPRRLSGQLFITSFFNLRRLELAPQASPRNLVLYQRDMSRPEGRSPSVQDAAPPIERFPSRSCSRRAGHSGCAGLPLNILITPPRAIRIAEDLLPVLVQSA